MEQLREAIVGCDLPLPHGQSEDVNGSVLYVPKRLFH